MQNRRFNLEREKTTPINWRRGMIRLWILASTAWIMGWSLYFVIEFINGATRQELFGIPVVLFGPPLALLLFGLAARWAFQGFETDEKS